MPLKWVDYTVTSNVSIATPFAADITTGIVAAAKTYGGRIGSKIRISRLEFVYQCYYVSGTQNTLDCIKVVVFQSKNSAITTSTPILNALVNKANNGGTQNVFAGCDMNAVVPLYEARHSMQSSTSITTGPSNPSQPSPFVQYKVALKPAQPILLYDADTGSAQRYIVQVGGVLHNPNATASAVTYCVDWGLRAWYTDAK